MEDLLPVVDDHVESFRVGILPEPVRVPPDGLVRHRVLQVLERQAAQVGVAARKLEVPEGHRLRGANLRLKR